MYSNLRTRFHAMAVMVLALSTLSLAGCGGDDSLTDAQAIEDDPNGISAPATEVITGTGSDVTSFAVQTSGAVTFELAHTGEGAFVVWLLDSDAERLSLLTAKTGDVSDTRVENLTAGSYFLDVDSTGDWSVSITGSAAGTPGNDSGATPGTDPATLPFVTFAASVSPPSELTIPKDEFRNAAVILDPERGPAPASGLNINYVLVDDPRLIQEIGMEDKVDSAPPDGTASIEGVVEVNNAEPIRIAGGDFAVTFQVQAQNSGTALLILVGGDGYVPPTWPDPTGQLVIVVEDNGSSSP